MLRACEDRFVLFIHIIIKNDIRALFIISKQQQQSSKAAKQQSSKAAKQQSSKAAKQTASRQQADSKQTLTRLLAAHYGK
jgi:hypothetical protein